MGKFSIWLEDHESMKNQQIRDIWADTFKALGIGGLSDEDAACQSLGKITYGERRGMRRFMDSGDQTSTFKGKKAAYKRLETGQIFNHLAQLGDPQIEKQVADVKQWLNTNNDDPKVQNNGDTTVATLLQKLFGPDMYQSLIDSNVPSDAGKLNKAPQMPPQNTMGQGGPPAQMPPDMSQGPQNQQSPAAPAEDQQMQQPQAQPRRPVGNPIAI